MTFTPCSSRHRSCSRWHSALVESYRAERRRQELQFENDLSYPEDRKLWCDRNRLVDFRNWLKTNKTQRQETAMAWEDIEPPMGAFIGWGQKKGQKVVGKVTEYDEFGGTDYNGKECPLLEIELTEKAASFNKKGERTNHDPGETVLLSCGQINLKKKIKRAELAHGDLIRIVLDDFLDTANGTVKEFTVQVDRSTRSAKRTTGSSSSARGSSASNDMDDDDEPDF